ncbi:MAG: hypothetical protein VXY94_07885 [Planctomycetota bacterium]|nr:hypothetical protein [Planctomycetota bacterium]MEC8559980.1 hypothetical protein [Planctomycetota bacterium]MEC9158388.1 hypothetical protein [Planctomycetota bacterium]MEC9232657.1 hypothetical protein [Planctomycetota bacterium]MED5507342.1 hypothetical protein [Planctomycetota bacterium]
MHANETGNPRPRSGDGTCLAGRLGTLMRSTRVRYALLGLTFAVAGLMIARPAGMLLWHRLRIITGMPRMAVANPEPRPATTSPGAQRPGAPGSLELDARLDRDPFAESLPNLPEHAGDRPDH